MYWRLEEKGQTVCSGICRFDIVGETFISTKSPEDRCMKQCVLLKYSYATETVIVHNLTPRQFGETVQESCRVLGFSCETESPHLLVAFCSLTQEMASLQPDVVSSNSVINAMAKSSQWQRAVQTNRYGEAGLLSV